MKIAIYPGSFDPVTNGHLDIILRASKLFDKLYVCVAINPGKKPFFSLEEKIKMLQKSTENIPNVEVIYTDGLVINKAKEVNAQVIVRGLRAVTDFEFEFQLAAANEYIDPSIEMVFLMTSLGKGFISSSYVKEFYQSGVDISNLVPSCVIDCFKEKESK